MTENERIAKICEVLEKNIPDPHVELDYISPYTFLISVVMSAQTTDVQVNKVTSVLFKKYNTIDQILSLGEEGLAEQIKSIGFFKMKAKHIIALSKILKEKFNGVVPDNHEDLMTLPGVGRKTANVVLNTLFHKPTIAVDTHVLRLSKRLGLSESSDPNEVEQDLIAKIPERYHTDFSNLLILYGRRICTAKKPKCETCDICKMCPYAIEKSASVE